MPRPLEVYVRFVEEQMEVLRHLPRDRARLRARQLAERIDGDVARGEVVFASHEELETFFGYVRQMAQHELPAGVGYELREWLGVAASRHLELPARRQEEESARKKASEAALRELAKIDRSAGTPLLFFLGAGASKPEPSNIPLVHQLLPELWNRSNQLETRPLESLQNWCEVNEITNIEEMLTAVYIANVVIRRPSVHGLLRSVLYPRLAESEPLSIRDIDAVSQFGSTLNTFFSLLVGTMLYADPNATHEAVARFVKQLPDATILTTNYDACVDLALDSAGVPYHYVIRGATGTGAIRLIKMHGSINWFYCENCQGLQMPTVQHMRESGANGIPYPVTGVCQTCRASSQQFIVPPTAFKYLAYPPIVQVWDEGRQAFETARMYVVVGYSFSDPDDYLAKMLLKALGGDPEKHVVIVDTSEETIDRFRGYITRHARAFDEKRIHDFVGSGADIVPRVVDTLIEAWDGVPKAPKTPRRTKAAVPAAPVPDGRQPENG
jgi:NAD-dependent SIR2 family protein deacetylase